VKAERAYKPQAEAADRKAAFERANAHSENKTEAALPVHRPAVGLCAI
jgi:hypothetical protein